jgi:hypothetical protein
MRYVFDGNIDTKLRFVEPIIEITSILARAESLTTKEFRRLD